MEKTPAGPNRGRRFKIRPDVLSERLDEEEVILDLASGTYFGLNPSGSRAWGLLKEGADSEAVVGALVREYGVPKEACRRDLDLLLEDLTRRGLVESAEENSPLGD